MGFFDDLATRIDATNSVVSVGLDPDPGRLPDFIDADLPRWAFNRRVIDATNEHAACYKPNAAFYEDADGWRALRETIAYAHGKDIPVLLDAKRADIGNTARQYARVLEEVDAITVNPYLGEDAIRPFLNHDGAGVFVLARTSNPGARDFQNLTVGNDTKLYEYVARRAAEWDDGNVGLVVGATASEELAAVRELAPKLPFLVPGVGAQGGDAEAAIAHGLADGVGLVNSSRGIIFAGEDSEDGDAYFRAVGAAARRLKSQLNEHR
ncbi:orotidine-5'-phosphate decarboxylase [Halosegnis sp.]|uniref:orotidine-5'-phosphate decarboxylase n=1 Tax=Halosegnis sp. TaxID=2864959 RepID=UPI0035D4A6E2